jgi:hypothetical protein
MKNLLVSKWFVLLLFFIQFVTIAQENKIKIYESKLGNSTCLIVFPCSPEPVMIITGDGACKTTKTMAADDWTEMSSSTVVTTTQLEVDVPSNLKSSRDAASGLATGKRQHKPFPLKDLTLDKFESEESQVYSFSWGMSNSGLNRDKPKPSYDLKKNEKARTMSSSTIENSCCSNGICTVTVSVSKKHTKTGHVTLLK